MPLSMWSFLVDEINRIEICGGTSQPVRCSEAVSEKVGLRPFFCLFHMGVIGFRISPT